MDSKHLLTGISGVCLTTATSSKMRTGALHMTVDMLKRDRYCGDYSGTLVPECLRHSLGTRIVASGTKSPRFDHLHALVKTATTKNTTRIRVSTSRHLVAAKDEFTRCSGKVTA